MRKKDEGEKVNVQVIPRERKSAQYHIDNIQYYIHIVEQQQIPWLQGNASFSSDQGSQNDLTVVADACTGNNRV